MQHFGGCTFDTAEHFLEYLAQKTSSKYLRNKNIPSHYLREARRGTKVPVFGSRKIAPRQQLRRVAIHETISNSHSKLEFPFQLIQQHTSKNAMHDLL